MARGRAFSSKQDAEPKCRGVEAEQKNDAINWCNEFVEDGARDFASAYVLQGILTFPAQRAGRQVTESRILNGPHSATGRPTIRQGPKVNLKGCRMNMTFQSNHPPDGPEH